MILKNEYENLINNLRMQGKSGLEQYTGAQTYEEYLCGYACKDNEKFGELDYFVHVDF